MLRTGGGARLTAGECNALLDEMEKRTNERDRARHLVKNLFLMTDREAWRASGGDDGQGHYEGDYHAAQLEEEIRSWEN